MRRKNIRKKEGTKEGKEEKQTQEESNQIQESITNSITIEIQGPSEIILSTTTVEISEGDTVFSVTEKVLNENNIPFSSKGTKNNKYVEGINNIYEFDYGPSSGFIYSVDGITPSVSSSKFELSDGEMVIWSYKK